MLWRQMEYDRWGAENCLCMYYRGVMEDGGEGKIRYNGGSMKCMLVRKGMGVEELRKMVRKTVGVGVEVDRMWYSLKYERNMIMAMKGNTDARMMFKGSDKHSCGLHHGKKYVVSVIPVVSGT